MRSDMSVEHASKQLEVAFKETETRLDTVGEKVDSALAECEKQKGNYRTNATREAAKIEN